MTEPIAETPRLLLRTWSLEDVPAGVRLWGDPEVMRYVDGGRPEGEDEVRRSIAAGIAHQERHGCQHWAVVETAGDELIGCAGFNVFEGGPDLELVVHLAQRWWGRGYATEACGAAIQVAWERLEPPRIVAGVHPENLVSARLLAKLGFERAGEHVFEEGSPPEPFYVLSMPPPRAAGPAARAFGEAVLAIDEGRVGDLQDLLARDPGLATTRTAGAEAGYFAGSTLLHHVAWNPFPSHRHHGLDTSDPSRMPRELPAAIDALVATGADPRAPNAAGNDVVGLLLTGHLPSAAGLTEPLLATLLRLGAELAPTPALAHDALANHAPAAARALLARGVPWDVRIAAGLGELGRLRELVAAARPSPHELGLAAIHAYIGEHAEALDWLLTRDLDLSATGIQNGTLLHRACADADLELVARLTELGADHDDRENPFRATPLDWADHGEKPEVVAWILANARGRLDLFQAAAHGLVDRAREILAANPAAADERRPIWRLGEVRPLEVARARGHEAVAALLEDATIDPDHS